MTKNEILYFKKTTRQYVLVHLWFLRFTSYIVISDHPKIINNFQIIYIHSVPFISKQIYLCFAD